MKTSSMLYSLGAAIGLSACAGITDYGGGRTWDKGWRKASVSSVNDELSWIQRPSCGKAVAPGDKIVSVSYRDSGQQVRWKFIPMPEQRAFPPQSRVLLNLKTCELVRDS